MFDFLPKPWNLWLNVECSFTRAGDHGELDWAGESDPMGLYCSWRLWRRQCLAYSLGVSSFHYRRRWPEFEEPISAREPLVLQLHKIEEGPQEYAEFLDLNKQVG